MWCGLSAIFNWEKDQIDVKVAGSVHWPIPLGDISDLLKCLPPRPVLSGWQG